MEFCKFCHQRGLKPGGKRCSNCKKWRDGKRTKYNKGKDQLEVDATSAVADESEDNNDGGAVLNVPNLPTTEAASTP
jgi:hypothetical protein